MGNALLLSLAWFGLVNVALSALAWAVAGPVARRCAHRGGALLALRLVPSGGAFLFVAGVFAPAHWRFEPRGGDEFFGLPVYAMAFGTAFLLVRAVVRGLQLARASFGLRHCDRLPRIATADGGAVRVYEVRGFTGVSLAGILRPRVLVGPDVRHALTAAEFDAAVSHELAHRAAGDNIKRAAMFCAPDFFGGSAVARTLESQWRAAAEWQADARAAAGNPARAVALASALIKVARLASSSPAFHAPAWSTLHEPALLERRVRRLLLAPAGLDAAAATRIGAIAGCTFPLLVVGAGIILGENVHRVTETLAHLLS